jgi:hypothetical protein
MLKTASVTPIALLTGDHGDAWQQRREGRGGGPDAGITDDARVVRDSAARPRRVVSSRT